MATLTWTETTISTASFIDCRQVDKVEHSPLSDPQKLDALFKDFLLGSGQDRASNIMGLFFFGLGRRAGGHRRGARLLTGPAGPMGAHGPHFYGQPGLWMRKQLNNDVYGKKDLELSWNWNCPETLSLKQNKGDAIGVASEP